MLNFGDILKLDEVTLQIKLQNKIKPKLKSNLNFIEKLKQIGL